LWNAAFAPSSVQAAIGRWLMDDILGRTAVADGTWCPLSGTVAGGWSRRLILTALG
jgi:hypothetical protein